MLEVFSTNVTVPANGAVPFNNSTVSKGCTAVLSAPTTIDLNKCGVYMVAVDGSAAASVTLQLTKDSILQPQAQSTGTSPSFVTLVQVDKNNSCCPCSSPTILRLISPNGGTLTNVNMTVTKVV